MQKFGGPFQHGIRIQKKQCCGSVPYPIDTSLIGFLSFLDPNPFIKDVKKLKKKVLYFKTFINLLNIQVGCESGWIRFVIGWPPGSGFVVQYYGSADLDPKEIFTDPQHCKKGIRNQ